MPWVKEYFAKYFLPVIGSPLIAQKFPSKSRTSNLLGKAYMAVGQASACLHMMGLLKAYQADLLKEVDDN